MIKVSVFIYFSLRQSLTEQCNPKDKSDINMRTLRTVIFGKDFIKIGQRTRKLLV